MSILKILLLILLFHYKSSIGTKICNDRFLRQILIVFSFDGFRNEYFNRNVTPFLSSVRENGVSSEYLKTVFLSNGLASHHTIATGVSASKHGVVGHMTRSRAKLYRYNKELYDYNRTILPIWTVNELNGGISACMMWPGSEFGYGDDQKKPTFYEEYNSSMPLEHRFNIIYNWLNRTRDQPNLIMVYIEEPDKIAHITGPFSKNLTEKLQKLDKLSKKFQSKLLELRLSHRTNIIYLSDHGMWPVTPMDFVNLSSIPECKKNYKFQGRHTNLYAVPLKKPDYFEKCHEQIDNLYKDAVSTWTTYQFLEGITIDRLSQTMVSAPKGIAWGDNMYNFSSYWARKYNTKVYKTTVYGVHGYKNDDDAIFMAKGPIFEYQKTVEPFDMVDLYNLFAKILTFSCNITNDGNFSNVADVFRTRTEEINWIDSAIIIIFCGIAHCVAFYISMKCYYYNKDRNEIEEIEMERAIAREQGKDLDEIMRSR